MTEATEDESRSFASRLNPWLTLVITAAAVLGLFWTVARFFNPIKDLDLTVWIQEEIDLGLPKEASSLNKLALVYDGKPMEHASVLRVNILNTGNVPIRPEESGAEKNWCLTLRSTNGAPIEQIGDIVSTPSNVEVSSKPGSAPDSLTLAIGLLNPKDSLDVKLVLVGPKAQGGYAIDAQARIPGLRNPVVTKSTVRDRIANGFMWPLWTVALILLLGVFFREFRREGWAGFGSSIWSIPATLFAAIFGSAFIAAGAGWLLSWIVYWVAFR